MKIDLRHHALSIIAVIFVSCSLTTSAQASSGEEDETLPCVAYWKAEAVFVGSVIEIIKVKSPDSLPKAIIHFSIEEPFRGVTGSWVEVDTIWGTKCADIFKVGEQYLIYAERNSVNGRLRTWCSDRTRRLSDADEDLAYIRRVSQGISEQLVLGKFIDKNLNPLKGVNITVEGDGGTYEGITDEEGKFRVALAKPGEYKVRATLPYSAWTVGNKVKFTAKLKENQTVIEYEVNIPKGQCDLREVRVFKFEDDNKDRR